MAIRTPLDPTPKPPAEELTAAELDHAGLLRADRDVIISRFAISVPADTLGIYRPITISAGATIGEQALIGAGCLVTRDIPAGAVAYGQPARVNGAVR
jgi:hypothetical protein